MASDAAHLAGSPSGDATARALARDDGGHEPWLLETDDRLDRSPGFAEHERRGLRLASWGQLVAIVVVALYFVIVQGFPLAYWPMTIVAAFFVTTLARLILFSRRFYRAWYAYPIVFLEVVIITVAIVAPSPFLEATWPRQTIFVQGNFVFYLLLLVIVAFSYRPRLVFVTGLMAALAWSGVSYWVAAMPDTVTWSTVDLDSGLGTEALLAVFYQPKFFSADLRIKEVLVLVLASGLLAMIVARGRAVLRRELASRAERERVEALFGRFVPEGIATRLIDERESLEPHEREATIMVVDVESFTATLGRHGAAAVLGALSAFFDRAERAIVASGGVLLHYQGDGFVAAFNLPFEEADYARQALDAACRIVEEMDRDASEPKLSIRIGLASGPVTAGLVGGDARLSYTVYGNAVNLAARLEQLNKEFGTKIVTDSVTVERAGRHVATHDRGPQTIRGFDAPVTVHCVPAT